MLDCYIFYEGKITVLFLTTLSRFFSGKYNCFIALVDRQRNHLGHFYTLGTAQSKSINFPNKHLV